MANQSGPNGTSFLQASNSARSMIKSLNLDTTPGKQQQLWSQAFNDYAATTAGHWARAQQDFEQLLTSDPGFKAAIPYRDYTQARASNDTQAGSTSQAQPTAVPVTQQKNKGAAAAISWQSIALTAGAVLVFVLLAVLLFASALRQRSKNKKNKGLVTPPAGLPAHISKPLDNRNAVGTAGTTPPANASAVPMMGRGVPAQAGSAVPNTTQSTFTLKAWPCGHMNRSNARFCSICGEPAPTPPTRGLN
ncbi:MAG: hypothetical protein NVS4B9_28980 [Ktedonobacteraceae bacterium]